MIEEVIRVIAFSRVISGIWALVSSGFTLIFGVARILNFAHGSIFMISAYFAITLLKYNVNPILSFAAGIIFSGIVGVLIYKVAMSPIKEHKIMVIIVSLAVALLIEQIVLNLFGEHGISFPSLIRGYQEVFGVKITNMRILAFVLAVLTIFLLEIFINRTRIGKMINAVAQDMEAAKLIGIDVERIYTITVFISSILAGLGGLLYSQIFAITPMASLKALIYAFAIVILGGLGSVRGSILASFIIGFIIVLTITFLGARWSEFIMLLTIIAILIIKPTGLFGVEE